MLYLVLKTKITEASKNVNDMFFSNSQNIFLTYREKIDIPHFLTSKLNTHEN